MAKKKKSVCIGVCGGGGGGGWNLHLFEFGYLENRINRKQKPRTYNNIRTMYYIGKYILL